MGSGLTKNKSKDLMNKYLSTSLPSDPGVWYGTLGGSPSAHSNCTLFSQWFLKNYTKGDVQLAMPSGNGFEMVDKFIAANGGKFSKSGTPQAFSLFSISPNNGNYGTYDAGHTGIVLGIDGNTVITGEANYGAPYDGLEAPYPNNGTVVMTRSLSTFNSSTGVTFVNLNNYLVDELKDSDNGSNNTNNDNQKGEKKMMISFNYKGVGYSAIDGVMIAFTDLKYWAAVANTAKQNASFVDLGTVSEDQYNQFIKSYQYGK